MTQEFFLRKMANKRLLHCTVIKCREKAEYYLVRCVEDGRERRYRRCRKHAAEAAELFSIEGPEPK